MYFGQLWRQAAVQSLHFLFMLKNWSDLTREYCNGVTVVREGRCCGLYTCAWWGLGGWTTKCWMRECGRWFWGVTFGADRRLPAMKTGSWAVGRGEGGDLGVRWWSHCLEITAGLLRKNTTWTDWTFSNSSYVTVNSIELEHMGTHTRYGDS